MTDKFYVGQRVRITSHRYPPFADGNHSLVGKVGSITAKAMVQYGHQRWYLDLSDENGKVCPIEAVLEPIYDGDTLVAWSDCAWRPKELVKA